MLLSQVLPFPPDSGPKVKTWNLIKALAPHHEITLLAFARDEAPAATAALRRHCRAVHTLPLRRGVLRDAAFGLASLVHDRPLVIARDYRREMMELVRRVADATAPDAVHADQLNMFQYAAPLAARRILDAHNALWLVFARLAATTPPPLRWLWAREARRLRRYEGACGRTADTVLAVSEPDRAALAAVIGGDAHLVVAPIGIDPDEVRPLVRRPDANRIAHIGTMHWPPNADGVRWFAGTVLPHIRAARPAARLEVIGARPPRAVRRLAAPGSGVTVTGYVPDPTPHLARAGVLIVPLRAAGGMRVKILHALAQGLPVVSTSIGCEGLAVEPGRDLLVADAPADFAAAVLRVLADPELAAALGRNGRALIERHYDYRVAYRPILDLYDAASGGARGAFGNTSG